MNLRTEYQKLEHQKNKAGPLTALQQWKLKHLLYLKPFYKQCHKSVQGSGAVGGAAITSTEQESDEDQEPEHDDRGHESSSSSRKETPTKIPVLNSWLPLRRPKKRREAYKEEKPSSLNQIMEVYVMKESASHLVSRARTVVNDRDREKDSFFQWLNEFTSRMPRQNWRDFQRQSIQLAMQFTPADSPQANPLRPRISQGPSASSHAQHPMDPPPRPAPTTSGGYMEMLQSQPQYGGRGGGRGGGPNPHQMVSNFLLYFFYQFLL